MFNCWNKRHLRKTKRSSLELCVVVQEQHSVIDDVTLEWCEQCEALPFRLALGRKKGKTKRKEVGYVLVVSGRLLTALQRLLYFCPTFLLLLLPPWLPPKLSSLYSIRFRCCLPMWMLSPSFLRLQTLIIRQRGKNCPLYSCHHFLAVRRKEATHRDPGETSWGKRWQWPPLSC